MGMDPDGASDRVTTDVPVESIGTDVADTDSSQTTKFPESVGESTSPPETTDTSSPPEISDTASPPETTDATSLPETSDTTSPPETTDTTSPPETPDTAPPETSDTTAPPETSEETDVTAVTDSTTDGQMEDIDSVVPPSENITEVVDEIFAPAETESGSSGTFTFTSTSLPIPTFPPIAAKGVDNADVSAPAEPEDGSFEINVNTDPGVLPNGAEAVNGMRNLYGSNDVFIHTSLCLLCIFFLSLR